MKLVGNVTGWSAADPAFLAERVNYDVIPDGGSRLERQVHNDLVAPGRPTCRESRSRPTCGADPSADRTVGTPVPVPMAAAPGDTRKFTRSPPGIVGGGRLHLIQLKSGSVRYLA